MERQNTASLARDRVLVWRTKSKTEPEAEAESKEIQKLEVVHRRQRVKRIFNMKTIQEIETHDQLWELMEGRPGWTRDERPGQVDYLLISSRRKCLAKASLPSNLDSASPEALEHFVNLVNKCEHVEIFALWETFKVRPVKIPSQTRNSVESHEEGRGSSSKTRPVHDRGVSSGSSQTVDKMVFPKKLYTG